MKKVLVVVLFCIASQLKAQNPYVFVFLNKKPDAEKLSEDASKKIMEGHMNNINRLAEEGKLIAAGPFEGGGGMFIMKTSSVEEAQQWINTDPGVQAKRWNVELFPFTPRLGQVCTAKEPYEMVMYAFVRFNAVVSKFNAATYPNIIKQHNDYLKQISKSGNVIIEGIFGDHEGGITIMKGEVGRELFETDPGVQEGLIDIETKKLYIAKGSFCEQ
ncbi:MAG TPA: YciI family protein [Chryseosolibacter sp.]